MAKQMLSISRYLMVLIVSVWVSSLTATTNNVIPQKIVQVAVTDVPTSLYPYAINPLPEQFSHLFFDPLVRWGQKKQLEFRLLEKLKNLGDKKTRFYLKKNIYFHSGNIVTSKDVVWSINAARQKKYLEENLQNSIKVIPRGKFQFEIESDLTQPQLLDYLTHVFILDSDFYKNNYMDLNLQQKTLTAPIKKLPHSGTGPYLVSSFYDGVNFTVSENSRYWHEKPMITKFNFMKIKSSDSRLYALLANDIDISEDIAYKKMDSLALSGNKEVYKTRSTNALFLSINQHKNAVFKREIARNAIHLAINQSGMLKHILNGSGDVERIFKVDNSESQLPTYDIKRAKDILKKINAPKTLSLLVMANKPSCTAEVVVALTNMLKKVGITLSVTEVTTVSEWQELQFGYDLTLAMWQTPLIEKHIIYQDIFTNSLISDSLARQFNLQDKILNIDDKISIFEESQRSGKIIPLFSKQKIWATDKQLDLTHLFSINGIPYWHKLNITE